MYREPQHVVFYCINGMGVGHATRLLAIAREYRSQRSEEGIADDIVFVTSSDGDQRLQEAGFPVFKVPSVQAISRVGRLCKRYQSVARRVLTATLEALAPDVLVLDGAPGGSFGELLPSPDWDVLDVCRHLVYVYRPVKAAVAQKISFGALFERFDRIIVPEVFTTQESLPSELCGLSNVVTVGPIISFDQAHKRDKVDLRRELGIPLDKYVVYVSTGGGGHSDAEAQLTSICQVILQMTDVYGVVACGPLYKGRFIESPALNWRVETSGAKLMGASDVAVSAAGANSFNELMMLGIPTVFVPLITPSDDQYARAERARRAGAAELITLSSVPADLPVVLTAWRDPSAREQLAKRARQMIPENGCREAARVLLQLAR